MEKLGCVHLVGAGPGDPNLLTLKARSLLDEADVVVYDRLVSDDIMALVPPGTARISVGKQPRCHPVPQQEINELLVRLAHSGRTIVRLKGGDPFLFGRGSEEAAHLRAHGVPFTVVPGVTSASGCAAAVGIPLTHRGLASGVHFVTGHCRDDADLDLNWATLAEPDTTLVIYMGMANIPQIAVALIAHGLAEATPAAAIANGSRRNQRHVISTLGEIGAAAASADFDGPVLFIIGRVVDLAAALGGDDVHADRSRLAEARRV
ncbi:MAG: uroporphyrinogen-III C-methyltransferase [Rhodospirillales bacterium]